MKKLFVLFFLWPVFPSCDFQEESNGIDPNVLLGEWILDMSPHTRADSNFALMNITHVEEHSFEGEFYREGVRIQNAQINTQLGVLYAALVSEDGTGTYNTSFYYKEGVLYGTTHAVNRNFLSVWIAKKARKDDNP